VYKGMWSLCLVWTDVWNDQNEIEDRIKSWGMRVRAKKDDAVADMEEM